MYLLSRLAPSQVRSLEDALERGAAERLLATIGAGLDAAPRSLDLARYLSLAARQAGDTSAAERLLRDGVERAILSGELLAAVDALRRLEAMDLDVSEAWDRLFDAVRTRGFATTAEESPSRDVKMHLEGELPSVTDLVARVLALERPEPAPFRPVAILSELSDDALRDSLRDAQIRVAPAGKPLRTAVGSGVGWLLTGAIKTPMGEVQTMSGAAFVAPTTERGPVASVTTRFITLAENPWIALRTGAAARPLAMLERRQRLAGALRRSELFRLLDPPGRAFFLENMRCVTATDAPVIHAGHKVSGLFIVVAGACVVIDKETAPPQEIARLGSGELFGELDVLTAGGAAFDVYADGAVELCLVDLPAARQLLRSSPNVRRYLVELTDERRSEVRVLDTGEVTLIDDPLR